MRILGIVGDINPLNHGGTIVYIASGLAEEYRNEDFADAMHFEPDPENESKAWLNCYSLDRYKVVGDVVEKRDVLVPARYDNTWVGSPVEREEWFVGELADACKSYCVTVDQFVETITSFSAVERAWAYEVIASWYGYHELSGGYEETVRVTEWRKRLALPLYQARRRGIL